MTRRDWLTAVVLAVVASVIVWFLGVDLNHAVVIVIAAFVCGPANGLLESISNVRFQPSRMKSRNEGLADIQALEFSLSAKEAQVGARALVQLRALAGSMVEQRGVQVENYPALNAVMDTSDAPAVNQKQFEAALNELETLFDRPQNHRPAPPNATTLSPQTRNIP